MGGNPAISLYSTADHNHGVVLTGVGGGMTASDLLSNHLVINAGIAKIN